MSNIKSHINSTKFLLKDMCYSVGNNFIYMKPAKTAGTTIYRRMFRLDEVSEGTASEGARLPPYEEEPKKEIVQGMGLASDCNCQKDDKVKFDAWWSNLTNEEIKNDYFKFVFVRNPFDRLVSAYSHLRQDEISWSSHRKQPALGDVGDVGRDAGGYLIKTREWWMWRTRNSRYYSAPDFKTFVKSHLLDSKGYPSNSHWLNQSYYVEVDGEQFVDFIGKFENLNKDFEVLCDKLNLDYKVLKERGYTGLPTVRFGGSHSNYKTYYDDETIELVSNVYRRDLELFDYEY
jgi:hypothetical protein